ncbi:multiple ankyrin repeats single kh domain [Fusarium longipes]|uniref:Multiple ankyrin repeats single kh domain n=1 Tax=Fusarium longipes TaxID=694270 RepID=A0A395SZQ9_9HYPO|nr:multiple ankyrin repeats single kh domain [Fusarium longipes]
MEVAASLIAIVDLSVSVSSACIKYIRGVANAANEATALHEELSSLLRIVSRLQLPSVSSSLKIELGPDIQLCHNDLLALQEKLQPAEGLRKIHQRLVWPFKKDGEFKNASMGIQRHLNIFEKAVAISTFEMTADIREQLLELRIARESDRTLLKDNFEMIDSHLSDIRKSMSEDQKKELIQWLNAVDCESNYRDNVALAAPNTGSWFFEETGMFAQWLGCGPDSPRNILVQGEEVEKLRSKHQAVDLVPVPELMSTLKQVFSTFDAVFLLVDALDECEKVDELLRLLQDLTRNVESLTDVRFMCSSRDESGIKQSLEPCGFTVQPLECAAVVQDIEVYVAETIRNDTNGKFRVFRGSSEGLRGDVITSLVDRSEGLSDLCKARRILSWLIGTNGEMTANMLIEALTIDEDKLEVDEEGRLQDTDEIRDICRSLVRETDHRHPYLGHNRKVITLAHFSVEQYLLSPQAGKFRIDLRDVHLQLARACLAYSTWPIWKSVTESNSEDDIVDEKDRDVVQFLAYTCGDIFSHFQYQNVEYDLVPYIIGLLQQQLRMKNLRLNCALVDSWGKSRSLIDNTLHIDATGGPWGMSMTRLLDDPLQIGHSSSFLSKSLVAGLYPTCISLIQNRIDLSGYDDYHQTSLAFIVATGRLDLVRSFTRQNMENYQRVALSSTPKEGSMLESILISIVNGLFTAIAAKWVDVCRELFTTALEYLGLFPNRRYSTKVYLMMLRLCSILSAAEGPREFLEFLLSHASSSEQMDAYALKQLEEEILYVSILQGGAHHVQKMLASGVSPTARINRSSNLRLLHQRHADKVTFQDINTYWLCYIDPEVLLNRIDTHWRDWEYAEEEPKIIATAAMHNAGISRLIIQGGHEEILEDQDTLVSAIRSWLSMDENRGQVEDLKILRPLLYDYLQRPENKGKLNFALNIWAGSKDGTEVIKQLIARGADPNSSIVNQDCHDFSTPLLTACRGQGFANVEVLSDAGADPNLETASGMLPSVALFKSSWCPVPGRERIFDMLKRHTPALRTSIARSLSPPPTFSRYGYGSRCGSVLTAIITGPMRYNIPVEFLKSRRLLDDLDRYLPGDEYGTPLIAAAATGNKEFVDLLIEHGATIDAPGHPETEWSHPALAAILADHWDLALELLEGFDASSHGRHREQRNWAMALILALQSDNQDVALALIEGGVDVNFIMDQGASPYLLYDIRESFHTDMDEVNWSVSETGTPMYAACAGGNLTLIDKLQSIGASQDLSPGSSYGDVFTAVCVSEKVEAVERFLKKGVDVNHCSLGREKWCPLVAAVQVSYSSGADEIVSLLIKEGAKANISYPFKNDAAEPSSLESLLLKRGKSLHFSLLWKRMWDDCKITGPSILNAKPFSGNVCIAAVEGRDEDRLEMIAGQEGVDVNREESCGIYPTAMMATLDMKKSYRVSDPLRKLGATEISASQMLNFTHPFRALTSDLIKENAALTIPGSFWGNMITLCVNVPMAIPFLLQQGVDPTEFVPGSFYGSALIAASALLSADTILHFLDHGCNFNATVSGSPFGTPLIAVCAGPAHYPFQWSFHEEFNLQDPPGWSMVQYDMLELLIAKGVDVNATHNGFSPLIALTLCDCAEEYKIKGLRLLLDKGADPNLILPRWGYNTVSIHPANGLFLVLDDGGQNVYKHF